MLLAIDVGNTNIVVGLNDGKGWLGSWRAATDPARMADEYAALIDSLIKYVGASLRDVSAVVVFLLAPVSEYTNGVLIPVDGGSLLVQ